MNIDYNLALKLKEGGFPQREPDCYTFEGVWIPEDERRYVPTLSELIEACGDIIRIQSFYSGNEVEWQADTCGNFGAWDHETHKAETGKSPDEAVAKLFLELKKKK